MPFTLTGQTVRFVSRDYEIDGRKGVSHKATVADGEFLHEVSIPEDLFASLGADAVAALGQVGHSVAFDLEPPRAFSGERGARMQVKATSVGFPSA
jgi:hypothetical protein